MSNVTRIVLAIALILLPLGLAVAVLQLDYHVAESSFAEPALALSAGVISVYLMVGAAVIIVGPIWLGIRLFRVPTPKETTGTTRSSGYSC